MSRGTHAFSTAETTHGCSGAATMRAMSSADDLLREYLADRSVPCPRCGYDLRALTRQRCPECGEALRLQVALVEPKLAAYITGLVGLAISAGFSGLLILFLILMSIIEGPGGPDAPFWFTLMGESAGSTALLAVWLAKRRAFMRLQPGTRWLLAGLTFIVPVASVVLAVLVID